MCHICSGKSVSSQFIAHTNLCFTSNGSDVAHFLDSERVNDGTFTTIRITNKANTDLLLVRVQLKSSIISENKVA